MEVIREFYGVIGCTFLDESCEVVSSARAGGLKQDLGSEAEQIIPGVVVVRILDDLVE